MKLLPIGTVAVHEERWFLIVGYGVSELHGQQESGYYAVPYPLGFLSMEKLLFLPDSSEIEVVQEGFLDEFSAGILELFESQIETAKKEPEQYQRAVERIRRYLADKEEKVQR